MAKILAIETSGSNCGIGIWSTENEPIIIEENGSKIHSEKLPLLAQEVLANSNLSLNDLDDTVAVQVTANLTDFYQYPVDNGTVLLNATGANIWLVCDPADTDGDGYVGECWEDTNGSGALEIPPTPGADTQNDDLGLTCSVCSGNGGFWNYDDSDGGEFNAGVSIPTKNGIKWISGTNKSDIGRLYQWITLILGMKYPVYKWGKNVGYGTQQHIHEIYKNGITSHHRKSFEPIKSLIHKK